MTERTTALTRLKKIGAFVAIVWGVAGSFVLLEILASSGTARLFEASDTVGSLGVSAEIRESVTCAPSGDGQRAGVTRPAVQAAAWSLGVQVGAGARWREVLEDAARSQYDPQRRRWFADVQRMIQQTDAEVSRLALWLNAPRPTAFARRHSGTALREFVTFVESDAQSTARALARNHGPRVCEAYKMGEYWGYSMMLR